MYNNFLRMKIIDEFYGFMAINKLLFCLKIT